MQDMRYKIRVNMSNDSIKSTPLETKHIELGAKMVPFAGWNMPVQYPTGILAEHKAVRETCGIFDISHMGQFFISGKDAASWLNSMLTNNIAKLDVNKGQYTIMPNDQGGIIDDLIIYRNGEESFLAVVNASKIDEDYAWLSAHLKGEVSLDNQSDQFAGMAVQGPNCQVVFAKVFPDLSLPVRNSLMSLSCNGQQIYVCRTGYTGEDGFEFFCPANHGIEWFSAFIGAGALPCGLGARDSLRLEMCFPLNGNDLDPVHTPIEAGLGFFCALDTDFTGVEIMRQQKADGPKVRLAAIEYTDKGAPPRAHYPVFSKDGQELGCLTSGVLSPSLKKGIGLAYLPVEFAKAGTELQIEVRGKKFPAVVVKKPFYKKG